MRRIEKMERRYSESHEWVETLENGNVRIGITDYAQNEMGDIVFVNLPAVGDSVTMEETFADMESVKAVSDVFSPVTGVVTAVNEELLDNPAEINEDPYGAWFVEVGEVAETAELMDEDEYKDFCAREKA
ncbi:MAG TPA: glycine cleavage system protein GcvH [Lachnospiraceae bacterium]|nr:glycine cleavage system protein GcvH [Lachnospiraceae bacterium]